MVVCAHNSTLSTICYAFCLVLNISSSFAPLFLFLRLVYCGETKQAAVERGRRIGEKGREGGREGGRPDCLETAVFFSSSFSSSSSSSSFLRFSQRHHHHYEAPRMQQRESLAVLCDDVATGERNWEKKKTGFFLWR